MRFWWTKAVAERADAAEQKADAAERDLQQVRADGPRTWAMARKLREQHEPDGWTDSITKIFGGHA